MTCREALARGLLIRDGMLHDHREHHHTRLLAIIVLALSGNALVACTDGDAQECTPDPVPNAGPTRAVRFVFEGASSGWVAAGGNFCSPFAISRGGGTPLLLQAPYAPECEGAAPPAPQVNYGAALAGRPEVVWNARVITSYQACADCTIWERGIVPVSRYAPVAAGAGGYVATFGLYDEVPAGCTDEGDGAFGCHRWDPSSGWPPVQTDTTCPLPSRTVTVPFTLPATGDLTVTVDLSAR